MGNDFNFFSSGSKSGPADAGLAGPIPNGPAKSGKGAGGCLAEEGALPYMKGGLQPPNPPPPPPPPLDPPLDDEVNADREMDAVISLLKIIIRTNS